MRRASRKIENAANLRGLDLKDIEVHEDVEEGVGFKVIANDPDAEEGENPAVNVTRVDGPMGERMFRDRVDQCMDALRDAVNGNDTTDRTNTDGELERLAEQESARSNEREQIETRSISETVDGESIETPGVRESMGSETLPEKDFEVDTDDDDVVETSGSVYVKVELDEFDDLDEVIEKAHAYDRLVEEYEDLERRVETIETALEELSETIKVPGFADSGGGENGADS